MRTARFSFSGLPVTRRQDPDRATAGRPPRRRRPDPLAGVLAALRGHQVTLLVGGRLLAGKLISADPVILVDGAGNATAVRRSAISAVRF
ncbi:hypothetical protein J2Z79_003103 [Symbiobacterium terraclitae]|uniref:Uncharacterized protein n=1 Tax=Symbiobacterium terraclitae TaxID=557451 RepID=A0ABS4JVX0_9FIRM|nr:hypothetical protein [Symbiobacterium terraclitae]MBP2019661.1 hypothetical protein [Symbiobacterium terraclitae]